MSKLCCYITDGPSISWPFCCWAAEILVCRGRCAWLGPGYLLALLQLLRLRTLLQEYAQYVCRFRLAGVENSSMATIWNAYRMGSTAGDPAIAQNVVCVIAQVRMSPEQPQSM